MEKADPIHELAFSQEDNGIDAAGTQKMLQMESLKVV